MVDDDEFLAVVIDLGSGLTKAGFSGEEQPRAIFPSVIGRTDHAEGSTPSVVCCELALSNPSLTLEAPVHQGVVVNWDTDGIEKLLCHTFDSELRASPREHPVLLADSPTNTTENREKATQVMFETFGVPALQNYSQAVLALNASGRTTGCVLDVGEGVSHAVSIDANFAAMEGIVRGNVTGRGLSHFMAELLAPRCDDATTPTMAVARHVKEKHAIVAIDSAEASRCAVEQSFELPDGSTIIVGAERTLCAEALFQTSELKKTLAVPAMVKSAISPSPESAKYIYSNIVLAGGSTMFPGFAERLTNELAALTPSFFKIKVVASPERRYSAWVGGSILSSISTFQSMWMSKAQYEESGPMIARKNIGC